MLKECVTPALRERGFRGGSGKYYLQGEAGHVGSLVMSGNPKRSTQQTMHVAVHIGVVSRYLRQARTLSGQETPARPSYALEHDWFDQVAEFTIDQDADLQRTGQGLVDLLDQRAVPAILESLDDAGLRRAVDSCPVGVGRGAARTLMEIELGNFEVARSRIDLSAERVGDDDDWVLRLRQHLDQAERHPEGSQ